MGRLVSISVWTGSVELVNDRWEAYPCGRSRLHWSVFLSLFFLFSSLVISGRPRSWEIDKKSSKQIENKLFTKCYSVNFYFKRTSEMKSKEDFEAPTLGQRLWDWGEGVWGGMPRYRYMIKGQKTLLMDYMWAVHGYLNLPGPVCKGYGAGTGIPSVVLSHHACTKNAELVWASFLKIHSGSQNLKPSPRNGVIISGWFSGHMINIYWTSKPTGTGRTFQEELRGYHSGDNIWLCTYCP